MGLWCRFSAKYPDSANKTGQKLYQFLSFGEHLPIVAHERLKYPGTFLKGIKQIAHIAGQHYATTAARKPKICT
jgi:hypothetical protein